MTDTLLSLAQLAVAITGFASIVLIFQRRESGRWAREGANAFNGMLFHSMAALVSCLVPVGLEAFGVAPDALWRSVSGMLGVVTVVHAPLVGFVLLKDRPLFERAFVLGVELPAAALLLATALGAFAGFAAGVFVAAVCAQILQATVLFFTLSFVRRDQIED